ncbi:hypothetical protein [Halorussus aquaticus]|uniref:Uncharacterized protein n=1 Tax=Halorussus aquaticus TaxID=2953748 RepID=A0ABD5Q4Z6_9EURY|nr:hypothetical protein [Halorussus aquaticus]
MNKKLLVAVVALGLLVGLTGQVGATVSTDGCLSKAHSTEHCDSSITLVSNDLVNEEGDLSVVVTGEDQFCDAEKIGGSKC